MARSTARAIATRHKVLDRLHPVVQPTERRDSHSATLVVHIAVGISDNVSLVRMDRSPVTLAPALDMTSLITRTSSSSRSMGRRDQECIVYRRIPSMPASGSGYRRNTPHHSALLACIGKFINEVVSSFDLIDRCQPLNTVLMRFEISARSTRVTAVLSELRTTCL